jgi:hypothetical protein
MAKITITNISDENILVQNKTGSGSIEVLDGVAFLKQHQSADVDLNEDSIIIVTQRNQL